MSLAFNSDFVGKLKLSFIMTKGQLEVDVIAAQGLKLEQDSSLGKSTPSRMCKQYALV